MPIFLSVCFPLLFTVFFNSKSHPYVKKIDSILGARLAAFLRAESKPVIINFHEQNQAGGYRYSFRYPKAYSI